MLLFSKGKMATTFEIEFTDDCIDEAAMFKFHSSGIVEHGKSNRCLVIKETNTELVALELNNNCNDGEAEVKISDFPPKGTAKIFRIFLIDGLHFSLYSNSEKELDIN